MALSFQLISTTLECANEPFWLAFQRAAHCPECAVYACVSSDSNSYSATLCRNEWMLSVIVLARINNMLLCHHASTSAKSLLKFNWKKITGRFSNAVAFGDVIWNVYVLNVCDRWICINDSLSYDFNLFTHNSISIRYKYYQLFNRFQIHNFCFDVENSIICLILFI